MAKKSEYKVVILGSGPAGLTAAVYASRANLEPLVVEGGGGGDPTDVPGGKLMLTTEVDNYPGFPEGIMGPELMDRMRKQAERFGTEFTFGSLKSIDVKSRPFVLELEEGGPISAQTLVVATGARARWLELPEELEFRTRGGGVSACATCDAFFHKGRKVIVVGGGDTAMEEASFLTKFAAEVTVVHRRDTLRASKIMQDRAFENPKIKFVHFVVEKILGTPGDRVTGVVLKNLKTGEISQVEAGGVFMAIGHEPGTQPFKGQLDMDATGYLLTFNGTTATSMPGVFAAGDVADHRYRQAITAAGSGCMAAIDAERFLAHPERPLRVLFLAPQPFFEVRGTPLAVLAMVRALAGLGHRVDLLTFPQGQPAPVEGVRHLRSLRLPVGHVKPGASLAKLLLDVPFLAEAALRLATGRYDVVHAVEEAAHLVAPVARLLRVPLVTDVDSAIPDQLRESGFARGGPLLWAAERLEFSALRGSAAVITVCDALTERVRRIHPAVPVFQVEDPPLVSASDPPPTAAIEALRRELGLGPGPVALYSGNFEPYQGVDLLVQAAALVPEVQFLFMGGEPAEVLARRAQAAASGARCTWAGKRPPSELPAFLGLAAVVVSPRCQGRNTPFFKVYTYLASGRPLVATRIETHTQLLDDGLALLVPPTPEGLAEGVRQVLADPAAAAERAARGVALVEREYSTARYAEKVSRAYRALAGAAG